MFSQIVFSKGGDTMTGAFNMGGHWITNLSKATSPNNAVTLTQLGESHISKHETVRTYSNISSKMLMRAKKITLYPLEIL